jgi:hypothetical protein
MFSSSADLLREERFGDAERVDQGAGQLASLGAQRGHARPDGPCIDPSR